MDAGHGRLATDIADTRNSQDCCINPTSFERMRISLFPAIIAFVAAALIAYLAYYFALLHFDPNTIVVTVGTFLSVLLTLGSIIALKTDDERMGVNIKTWSGVAFFLTIVINVGFACLNVVMPFYVIILGLFLLIHLWIVLKIASIKDA